MIAHELLHNLGHMHLSSRSEPDYYLYQMILVEMSVMTDGKAEYGEKIVTPVLCKRWQ